jgi:hypothetical protein
MPLTRASEQPVFRQDEICFLMKDGEAPVICGVSTRVLLAFGDPLGMNDAQTIFWAHREKIERAESQKYDRTGRVPYEILDIGELG